jgi:phenylacetate-CoA ligase
MYGSNEFELMGWECRTNGGLHVCDDGLILEVIRGGEIAAENEQGEVVATNLHAFAMPLIRYRIGDVVTQGRACCPCGRPFSTIRAVQGRVVDYFRLPDGRLLHPYGVFRPQCEATPWIRQYRVTQEGANRIVLQIVPAIAPGSQDLAAIRTAAMSALGPDVNFEIQLTQNIPLEPNGKFRVYRSLMNSGHES